MEFSSWVPEVVSRWSPDGLLIAAVSDAYRSLITVRSPQELRPVASFEASRPICNLEWSPDGVFLLAVSQRDRGLAEVFDVMRPEWRISINEGSAGLVHARWTPDSRFLVTLADFKVRLSVWDVQLASHFTSSEKAGDVEALGRVTRVPNPKHGTRGLAFTGVRSLSADGSRMCDFAALSVREDCRDSVCVMSCYHNWEVLSAFPVRTHDLQDLVWDTQGLHIIVWDCPSRFGLFIYTANGTLLRGLESPTEAALGISMVVPAPPGVEYVAVGTCDGNVRILNEQVWEFLPELRHRSSFVWRDLDPIIYRQVTKEIVDRSTLHHYRHRTDVSYELVPFEPRDQAASDGTRPSTIFKVPSTQEKKTVATPREAETTATSLLKAGITMMCWSPNSQLLATKYESHPNVVWIWDTLLCGLTAMLIQQAPVRHMSWFAADGDERLIVATGERRVFAWSRQCAFVVEVPDGRMQADSLRWTKRQNACIIQNEGGYCVAHPQFNSSSLLISNGGVARQP